MFKIAILTPQDRFYSFLTWFM